MPPTTQDFPDHWGFYILQAINRLDDKIDDVRHRQERTAEALRQEIGGVRQEIHALDIEFGQKLGALDSKFGQQIAALDSRFGQQIAALDSRFDQRIAALDTKFDQRIAALDTKFGQRIAALDTKFDHKLTNLQYWYWSMLIVIIVGFVTVLFTHP